MLENNYIWVGKGELPCNLLFNQANRHGLIAGASGAGKTVTLEVIANVLQDLFAICKVTE